MLSLLAGVLLPSLLGAGLAVTHGLVGVVVVLLGPGYAISCAALPTRALGFWERLTLSLGLSIAAAAFTGLVLTWTPFGLRAATWLVALGTLTVVAAAIALWRRARSWEAPSPAPPHQGEGKTGVRVPLLLGLATLIAAGAIAVAYVGVIDQVQPGYTELWLLPAPATAPHSIRIGVKNMEPGPVQYRLVVELANQKVEDWSPIELQPGQSWQATADLPATLNAGGPVQAFLYKLDAPQRVYRWARLAQASAAGAGT
jgi:uncharacterized protein DUF1616